jgi:hypothetical protein
MHIRPGCGRPRVNMVVIRAKGCGSWEEPQGGQIIALAQRVPVILGRVQIILDEPLDGKVSTGWNTICHSSLLCTTVSNPVDLL